MDTLASLLRALTLVFQCGMVGGAVFALAAADTDGRRPALRLAALSALAAVAVSAATLAVLVRQLMTVLDLPLGEAMGAGLARQHLAFMAAAGLTAGLCALHRTSPWLAATAATTAVFMSVLGSHAASRLEGREIATAIHLLHQLAAGIWLGGIPFLLLALRSLDGAARIRQCRRFSRLAMASVAGLALSAVLLARLHVGSWAAMVGSNFGAMATVKAVLMCGLLVLGLCNLRAGAHLDQTAPLARLRSLAAAEIAIGIAVLVVAASLASQPPPAGASEQVIRPTEVLERLLPHTPSRFTATVPSEPGSIADRAWAEMTHHWAGAVVLAMGLLALIRRVPGGGWARHWPLLFLVMAIGIPLLSDPDSWPMGPYGFWGKAGGDWEVIEHRLAALLTAGFGIMEWAVQTGRVRHAGAALVFPSACMLGGLLLFTHGHPSADAQVALPIHLSYIAIAVLALAAGTARWAELTADNRARRLAGWLWPAAFALVGVVLILYREI